MTHSLLKSMNTAQAAAVSAPDEHCLVLAGAGSGKTRVLIHRIAWLIDKEKVKPFQILAVTFTNKAATEMRERLDRLRPGVQGYWVGTFHGIAHRLLRLHPLEAGLPVSFQVLDADDQVKMVKKIIKDMSLEDNETLVPRDVASWISSNKDEGRTPETVRCDNPLEQSYADIFKVYQQRCDIAGLVDFAELLSRAYRLLLNTPALLDVYRYRFNHLLVDEFQDTNTIQYDFIRLLAGETGRVFVVGDDDQAIYGWRGAKVENVQKFLDDNPSTQIFKLEQNYRSSGHILRAANAIISNNPNRLGKSLWTGTGQGALLEVRECLTEVDEARVVVEKMKAWRADGNRLDGCAVLYRSNAQSRAFEEQLLASAIPYRIYGGLKFFERAEVKDAMAYLRLVASRRDDAAFERVVNVPARGLGEKALKKIRDLATQEYRPFWEAAQMVLKKGLLSGKSAQSLQVFLNTIDELDEDHRDLRLERVVSEVIARSGLREHHSKESKADKDRSSRIENLDELVAVADRFEFPEGEARAGMTDLQAFLAHAALEAGERGTGAAADRDAVQMMTLHSAKGLEFPMVFMVGMEEGLFPSARAMLEDGRLDEERRLAYVGVTRAMKKLVLTYAKQRRLYGQTMFPSPSLFLSEIPKEIIKKSATPTPKSSPGYVSRYGAGRKWGDYNDEWSGA